MELIKEIWYAEIQVAPVLLSILLFELFAIIRRWKKLFYVPIYFSVFPLREINQDLSTYLVEDEFIGLGERLTDDQADKLRKKIIVVSIISMTIATLLTPVIVGFLSAFYMDKETFFQFIFILLSYKVILLIKSIYQFHLYAVGSIRNRFFLGFIYICYLGVVFEVLRKTYSWTKPFVLVGDWTNLLSELSSLVFGKVLVGVLIVSLLTAVFVSLIADREVRRRALSGDE